MTASLGLSDRTVFIALEAFLQDVLPSGDAVFTGFISGPTLTVTNLKQGTIELGDAVLGEFATPGTLVSAAGPLSGGIGTYAVNPPQAVGTQQEPALFTTGIEIIKGQVNRVPEPVAENFVVMTAVRRSRIETNAEDDSDVVFVGSIAGKLMTVTEITRGAILVGAVVFGVGVNAGARVLSQPSGTPGGIGTYALSTSQNVLSSNLASGAKVVTQGTEYVIQLDCHGPLGADIAQEITTLFRDEYAATFFNDFNPDIAPLYADEPKQVPFINAEQQWEDRWAVAAHFQINPTVSVPQQFSDVATVTTIEVEAEYPII